MLFKHVLCFARIMSTHCPNSCRQTARIGGGGQLSPLPPVPYAYGYDQGQFGVRVRFRVRVGLGLLLGLG